MSSPETEHFPPGPFGLDGRDSGKKSQIAERGKSCPTLCVYSCKGEVAEEGVQRVEFYVSLSLFLHFPPLLRLLATIVFPCDRCSEALSFDCNIWNDFLQTRRRCVDNPFLLRPFLVFFS